MGLDYLYVEMWVMGWYWAASNVYNNMTSQIYIFEYEHILVWIVHLYVEMRDVR